MKYYGIFVLFIFVFLVSIKPVIAATVYNRISCRHCVQNTHDHRQNAEVKACKPPREEDVLNRKTAAGMFITCTGSNFKFSHSFFDICRKLLTFPASFRYILSNSSGHTRVLSSFIFFPFHSFW